MSDIRQALSRQQAAILDCIRQSVAARGYPPTLREIGEKVGLLSTSSVAHQLDVLAGRGYIVRDYSKPRAITVLPPPVLTVVDDADENATLDSQANGGGR